MTPVAGGGSSVKGEFITGQTLTGSSTPAGLFTVTVAGMDCSLVYSTKNVGTPNVTTTGTTATATKAADAAPAPAAATAAAANTTAAKSSAAAAAPAALMALVAGALALAF